MCEPQELQIIGTPGNVKWVSILFLPKIQSKPTTGPKACFVHGPAVTEEHVSGVRVAIVVRWVVGAAVSLAAAQAQAQNLDAGKSPAQIFSDTCSACHRSPREVKQTSPGFLREHYTTGAREAATMAAYLASVGSDSRAIQQRKPPNLGAGQGAPSEASRPEKSGQNDRDRDQSKPADNQAALPGSRHTPAGSTEAATPAPATATATAARSRRPSDSVEAGQPTIVPTAAGADAPQTAATPAGRPSPAEDFDE